MKKTTVSALYETRQDAEAARDRLAASPIEAEVEIHDDTSDDGGRSFMDKLKDFFGGHDDHHAYGEGVRRGKILVTARVEEYAAERAAELMDASNALAFGQAQESWRRDGWVPPPATAPGQVGAGDAESRPGDRVRSYRVESVEAAELVGGPEGVNDPAMAERARAERTEEGVMASDATVRPENDALARTTSDDPDEVRDNNNRRG
jgi:hypothetical protein